LDDLAFRVAAVNRFQERGGTRAIDQEREMTGRVAARLRVQRTREHDGEKTDDARSRHRYPRSTFSTAISISSVGTGFPWPSGSTPLEILLGQTLSRFQRAISRNCLSYRTSTALRRAD